jgi:Tfp pilus assembly protein PilV
MHPANELLNTERSRDARADSGFTILETVIALFIAMVIGFGAISLFLFSTSFNAGASDRARALALAQQLMEEYRAKSYSTLTNGTTNTSVSLGSTAAGEADRRTFAVIKKIENGATTNPTGRQKKITVTVTPETNGRWTGGGVTLVMLRASDVAGAN